MARGLVIALALILAGALALTGAYEAWLGLNPSQGIAFALLLIAAILWVSEFVPLFVTSFIILLLELVWLLPALEAGEIAVSSKDFMSPFFSNIILLFMGGLVLSILLHRYGIDQRMARWILRRTAGKPSRLLIGVILIAAFLSMWMSNTATAAMMFAIMLPVIRQVPEGNEFSIALALAIPFAANVGGMGTPIGSPPNAIAIGYLTGESVHVSFATWMLMMLPFLLVLLVVLWALLMRFYPAGSFRFELDDKAPRPLTRKDLGVIGLFVLTCLAWLSSEYHGLSTGVVSLILVIICFGSRILNQEDFRSMSWDILFLIGGGLALGVGLQASGLTDRIVTLIPAGAGIAVVMLLFLVIAGLMTTFMSNSATANLVIPLAVSIGGEMGVLVLGIALMCSSAMALPVSTPPNAIAFSSGILKSRDMILTGTLVSVAALILVAFLGRPYWSLFEF